MMKQFTELIKKIISKISLNTSSINIKHQDVKPYSLEGYYIITTTGGDIEIKTYPNIHLEPKAYSSFYDIELKLPEFSNVYAKSEGGDIELKGRFSNVYLNSYGGDIEFEGSFEYMEILKYKGSCELEIDYNNMTLEIEIHSGKFDIPPGYRKADNKYIWGTGKTHLKIIINNAYIKIKSFKHF